MEVWTRRNWGVLTYYSQNWKRGKKDFFPSKRKKRRRGQIGLDFSTCPKPQRKRRVRSEMSVTPKKRKKSHLDFSLSPFRKGENSMRCCFQFGNVSAERKRIIHYVSPPPWPYLWVCMSNVADMFMGKEDSQQRGHKKEHQQEWFPVWQMGQMSLRKRRTDFHFFPFREVGGLFRQVIRRETKNAIQRHGTSRKKVGKSHCVITKFDAAVA